ncbi:hypothetical protein D4764_0220160 [Takifugu flavidus]|uniref:Uncharacterized protein n=1 Tax=Takifugu flavidus TaxID=433684 RepID=A0A5C6MEW6_9TELE|nr:hypothetical protein D4764_0220160 [Takifugu flavidus]
MDRVDELAEYLVELREQTGLTLNNQQVSTILGLWQNLDKFDKDRIVYAARHQDRLLTGRFRSPKKKAVFTPGVESTKRCVLGSSGSPAQWPNCCRLIETIFVRLCNIHTSPKKEDNTAYLDVNQTTLMQWYNQRLKGQEVSVLLQGVQLPVARPVAADPLPCAKTKPISLPHYQHQPPAYQLHTYHMPANTAGQAKPRVQAGVRRIEPAVASSGPSATLFQSSVTQAPDSSAPNRERPILPKFVVPQFVLLPQLTIASDNTSPAPEPHVSTVPDGKQKRKYNRTVTANSCRACGQFRTVETGHSQYKGKIYCPNTEALTKEQWLKQMRQ